MSSLDTFEKKGCDNLVQQQLNQAIIKIKNLEIENADLKQMTKAQINKFDVSDKANCFQCNKKTNYAVSTKHKTHTYCTFHNRPYCENCWTPVSGKDKYGVLGHTIYHSKWDHGKQEYMPC